jgi:hypothetical protein
MTMLNLTNDQERYIVDISVSDAIISDRVSC